MKLFVSGRKTVFETLAKYITASDQTIWFHCASLGEFEQGLPIMEAVKKELPNYKIVVSFFSPSGYEIKKKTAVADVVVYLPLDTIGNAKNFVRAVHPSLAVFVKYEFWPNYLFELKRQDITTILVSGLFREGQVFFKGHGGLMRNALKSFDRIFVQDAVSEKLLKTINITNVTVSGDTRFDRVSHQIEQDNTLPFAEVFKNKSLCVVCGSTWPEDEAVLLEYMNLAPEEVKFIVAPHNIDHAKIEQFRKKLKPASVLFSEKEGQRLQEFSVLIIDTVGLLSKIYSYADIAYVGGAMGKTGLHNILEPATFGVPIVIGSHFENFPEAKRLQQLAGLYAVDSAAECTEILSKLATNKRFRLETGMIAGHFVNNNTGATKITLDYIRKQGL
ncbi:3-deoxy-D-manno-octulosonic acid transferase [Marixanthomonas spongiae]|uniref:3-deoxy-D-manno-octulosonic acid transferase n=2 Tax=Marixanthomonas spongiae TaxID=2174845 RepID=A0A2U0HZP8_9FLAO|nr:3-deoxy-D-manno-octulosonic acid transferase [Marixanthomonas spongiae]